MGYRSNQLLFDALIPLLYLNLEKRPKNPILKPMFKSASDDEFLWVHCTRNKLLSGIKYRLNKYYLCWKTMPQKNPVIFGVFNVLF
ncbi:hypothetical protein Y032_0082g1521 [Ancylostoma ceylanicum]|uniref:Uncharacterized protein n=1 Tax=Ancylostoma ceylanicum TaxID=53326 RepID=A0A016TRE4_9BILA|nr:hypothetical protein Y032_0082g1521 [Ancylostoma ceylanicum]